MMTGPERKRRVAGLVRSVELCRSLDAAERDGRKARAALLIAHREIERARVKSRAIFRGRV